ncbi:hypothetical protein OE88DRAFT_1645641 [Heliocybe sulcata]|uniref:Uncharacterized protein n=1 Tax=Heliocybe sulcata TaxID=5364 RepID=A0A5C3MZ77_9AGAM|nr:hypothetical protein OE88DRAFT_1645641 [Heliocybe sulcata]
MQCDLLACAELLANLTFPRHAITDLRLARPSLNNEAQGFKRSYTALELVASAIAGTLDPDSIRPFLLVTGSPPFDRCVEFKGCTTVLSRDMAWRRGLLKPPVEQKFQLTVGTLLEAERIVESVTSRLPLSRRAKGVSFFSVARKKDTNVLALGCLPASFTEYLTSCHGHGVLFDGAAKRTPRRTGVEFFQVEGMLPLQLWKRIFRKMQGVTQLYVHGAAAENLSAALCVSNERKKKADGGRAGPGAVDAEGGMDEHGRLFPLLEYIQLDGVLFYGARTGQDFIEQFETALKSRRTGRHKFPHVEVKNGIKFTEKEDSRLKKVVQKCTWDGLVRLAPADGDPDDFHNGVLSWFSGED